jgi:hypothetical protein
VVEHGHWVFGRKGDGYIGIYSQTAPRWLADQHDDAHSIVELRADASTNVWIVEVGDAARHGSFAGFVAARSEAAVTVDDLDVWYASPSVGVMEFGWRGPLQIDGVEIALHDYPRFDNPYCRAEFGARSYRVEFDREQYEFSF